MRALSRTLTRISEFLDFDIRSKHFFIILIGFLILYALFYINAFHESYPDEYDNITGGWFIIHGILPYSGFFTHHGPVAYFIAAIVSISSWGSFVKFRIIYSILLFLYLVWSYLFIRRRFGTKDTLFYLLVIGIIGFAGSYFWGHMLLADSLAAFFLVPVFALLLLNGIYRKPFTQSDIIAISLLTSLAVLSSLTYIYLAALIYMYCSFHIALHNKFKIFQREVVLPMLIFITPYAFFGIYLLLTGGLRDYIEQAITFNRKYYIYNYPGGGGAINPIRYAIHIAYTFFTNFTALLVQVKDFNFNYPYNITLALGNVAMIIYLLLRRQYIFSVVFILMLIFMNVRTNPLDSKETDYQSAVYMVFSFINLSYLLINLYKELQATVVYNKKLIYTVLFLLLSVYSLFAASFILNKFFQKAYTKYMGMEPWIYDRPDIAPMLNAINESSYYTWVGPFEFEEWLYIKGKMPSKYHILLPGMAKSTEMQAEMISDFERNKPETIWFNKNTAILGSSVDSYSGFFKDFLSKHYTTLYEYRQIGKTYTSVEPINPQKDIETMLYIRKDKADEIIQKLVDKNYIRKSEAE